jgi:putative aldouronate transport system permease protein
MARKLLPRIKKGLWLYIMFLPTLIFVFLFNYLPILGIRFSFYRYNVFAAPRFVGWANFQRLFGSSRFWSVFRNTIQISLMNLIMGMVASVLIALLINEIGRMYLKRPIQTIIYLPHFMSWVVVASIFHIILSPQNGFVNNVLTGIRIIDKPIYFMANEKWWRPAYYFVNRWKETGWGTVIYLAALTGINPELYESAAIDGAGKLKQAVYITLPCIFPTIIIVLILQLSRVLNIFESILVMYNPAVYSVADVIQTYNYRVGLLDSDYGYSTAVGLFRSIICMFLVIGANFISKRVRGRGIL